MSDPAAVIVRRIEADRDELLRLSHEIHRLGELAFEETRSAAAIADCLRGHGFDVTVGCHSLPTAIDARFGSGPVTITFCAEYDALVGIGHGCGHNIIAAAGVGAALGLAAVADDLGVTVRLLGTPAEEHGGGKVLMLRAGAWDDTTATLMIHPYAEDSWPDATIMQAVHRLRVDFTGRSSHAAAGPQEGINAGDAATIALVAIGLLRQQVRDGARISAFVSSGGDVTNIIPGAASVDVEVRERGTEALAALRSRVLNCFAGAALATGCTWRWSETEPMYADLVQDRFLVERFAAHLAERGRPTDSAQPPRPGGSTDMGNVSQTLPTLHAVIGVRGADAPIHTDEFARAAATTGGDDAIIDAAVALALTAADLVADDAVRADFLERQDRRLPPSIAIQHLEG